MPIEYTALELPIPEVNVRKHDVYSPYAKAAKFEVGVFEGQEISIRSQSLGTCQNCGERIKWKRGPDSSITAATACTVSNGTTYSNTINIASGRIVFADSLFHVFPELKKRKGLDYNSAVGRKEFARRLAENNIAYGSVINTSPTLYLDTIRGGLAIADVFDDYYDEDEDSTPEGWKELGLIITDLWAYSITDYDTFMNYGGDPDDPRVTIAEIPAGKYTFTHYADQASFDDDLTEEKPVVIFADAVKESELS